MVLPHPKGVKTDGVRQFGLFQQFPEDLRRLLGASVRLLTHIPEGVEADQDAVLPHRVGGPRHVFCHHDSFSQPASSAAQ